MSSEPATLNAPSIKPTGNATADVPVQRVSAAMRGSSLTVLAVLEHPARIPRVVSIGK